MIKCGKFFEDLAVKHLQQNGFIILGRNCRWKRCEVDIICKKNEEIYAIEVKYRKNTSFLCIKPEQLSRIETYMLNFFPGVFFKIMIIYFDRERTPHQMQIV